MSFSSDDDNDDSCEPEKQDKFLPSGAKFFQQGKFDGSENEMRMFNVDLTQHQLILATALLNFVNSLAEANNLLRVAVALRDVLGSKPAPLSKETLEWNDSHPVGQMVQVWPHGRDGESYLSRTSSPAIDTAAGPAVILEHFDKAVTLLNVTPRNLSCPEVTK